MTVRRIVIGYFSTSLVALLFGSSLIDAIDAIPRIGDSFMSVLFCMLGPFAFLSYVIRGRGYPSMAEWSVSWFGVSLYVLATALLAGCLALSIRQNRFVRLTSYAAASVIWALSGYLMLLIQMWGA